MSEWISVSKQLPENEDWVLVALTDEYRCDLDPYCAIAWLNEGSRKWEGEVETLKWVVTHWQPLPAPPSPSHKERRDEKDSDIV